MSASDIADMVQLLSYHDSPEHKATVARDQEQILAKINESILKKNARITASPYEPTIPHISTPEDLPLKGSALAGARVKSKSRKRQNGNVAHRLEAEALERSSTAPSISFAAAPKIPLPKKVKSIDTLRLLFPIATSDFKGATQWIDLTATLQELGLEGEHRGGSEWTFRSGSEETIGDADINAEGLTQGRKSIVIHQPHPDTKMGAVRLQQIGKRLRRRFGWSRDRFESL